MTKKAVFFTDSDCELPLRVVKELKIDNLIKMPYTICGEEYFYDFGEDFDPKKFYSLIREGNMPITSGLNAEIYKEYFEPFFKEGDDILYVSFSSKMSSTFASMDIAVKELQEKYPDAKFRRYDSKGISMAAGLVVYAAAKKFNEGMPNDEICAFLDTFAPRTNACFSPQDLFHLKRGGRLSAVSAALGTILQLKPIIRINDEGKLYSAAKVNGRNKALKYIADEVIANVTDTDKYPIIILNADCPDDAEKIRQKLVLALPEAEIWSETVGPVIGTHCGPDTIAVCYVGSAR